MAEKLDFDSLGVAKLPHWAREGVDAARRTGVLELAANAAGKGLDMAVRVARRSAAHFDTPESEVPSPDELDELWLATRKDLTASPVRDGRYLKSRFGNGAKQSEEEREVESGDPYTFVAARERGLLLGVAVVRRPRATSDARLGGIRVATMSELVFPIARADAGLATLGAVERVARASGADAITCMTSHPALSRLLRRQGYLRLAGNVHFFLRDVTDIGRLPTNPEAWWLGRGDGESDTSF
jgi:hypothetical protein